MKITNRQNRILNIIERYGKLSQKKIQEYLKQHGETTAKITVLRDLRFLIDKNFIEKAGNARATTYQQVGEKFFRPLDLDAYFQKGPDERQNVRERFDFDIFENVTRQQLFHENELRDLQALQKEYREHRDAMNPLSIEKEFERLTVELSWKSSQMEGNTYTLLETETLLTKGEASPYHTSAETTMIVNHKKALEYVRTNATQFQTISLRYVENIHELLVQNLPIPQGLRERPVGITGTRYRPLDNIHQIREAMEKMCILLNAQRDPFSRVLLSLAFIAYIQPFHDGNKRTSRLLANAILFAHDYCPLSFRNVSEVEYKKAILIFFEQHNLRYLKELFIAQTAFAVENYFQ